MGSADYYQPGGHNKICDRTGFKIKATDAQKEWNGLVVRRRSFELRHPQDFLRSKKDHQAVADPRSEATNSFIGTNTVLNVYLDPDTSSASASAAAGGGNTGDGTITGLVADLSADSSYTLTVQRVTRAAEDDQDTGDKGEFRLVDSNSDFVALGQIGVALAGGGLCFTLKENGSVDFIVGDNFTITVTIS